jgi:hypothetical protein
MDNSSVTFTYDGVAYTAYRANAAKPYTSRYFCEMAGVGRAYVDIEHTVPGANTSSPNEMHRVQLTVEYLTAGLVTKTIREWIGFRTYDSAQDTADSTLVDNAMGSLVYSGTFLADLLARRT